MEYLNNRRESMPQSSPKQSSPIPIRKISRAFESPYSNSYSPTGSKGSVSPISSHRTTKNSSRFNGVPKIMVFDSQGQVWSSGELNNGHESSPSPPSSSPSFSNFVPHVNSTQSLTDPMSETENEESFYSQDDVRVSPRRRRTSLNLKAPAELSYSQQSVSISGTRFCASEDEAEEIAVSIYTKKKKRKFLNVYEPQIKSRTRSKSTDASIFMQESPSSSNKMKKFFKRLRSKSQGDITAGKNLRKSSNSNSQDDINSDYEGSYSDIPIGDSSEVAAAAINVSLLSKIKNYIKKQPRKNTSHDLYSNSRSSRKNSEVMGSDDDFHDCLQYPFESFESIPNSDYDSQDKMYGSYSKSYSNQGSRSNSEYELTLDMKVKKKSLVSRFKNMAKNKKRDRSGSLPNVLDGVEIKQLSPKVTPGYHQKRKRSSLSSSSDRNDADKIMFIGDLAIENYFGENGETLSLENLSESRGSYERIVVKKEYKLSMENIFGIRGKSRSMDYTFHRPFDLETLKRRLGDRSSSEPNKDLPDASEVRGDGTSSDKKGSSLTLLSGSVISYTVQANDTLMSIAARFDTTPSELTKMNRLSTRFLFPGQILTVPDKGGAKENLGTDSSRALSDIVKEAEISPFSTDVSSQKSSDVANCPKAPANSLDTDRSLDKECLEKFLKIQVRHITDGQGVVAGVLLVTPNAVMFDPNVSDPLVIERGSESYGVIAPMDFVVNAALYYDIAHMKVKDTGLPRPEIPKPEIYYGPLEIQEPLLEEEEPTGQTERLLGAEGEVGMLGGSEESPSKDGTFPELTAENDNDNDSTCSCGGETRETSAFPKAFEHELLTPISADASPTGGEAASQQPPSFVQGDLAPIEGRKAEKANASPGVTLETPSVGSTLSQIGPAQDQCDTTITATPPDSITSSTPLAQEKPPLTGSSSLPPPQPQQQAPNDKKRTTSVTFSTSSDSDMPPLLEDDNVEMPSQESRKQKVLKRISYPLSWMESFGGENKDLQGLQPGLPSSAPPSTNWMGGITGMTQPVVGDLNDSNRQGMFSNVFTTGISNVSNMLTSSPKYLADFGSGLFTRSPSESCAGGSGSVRDIPNACPSISPRLPINNLSSSSPSLFPPSIGGRRTSPSAPTSSSPLSQEFDSKEKRLTMMGDAWLSGRTSQDYTKRNSTAGQGSESPQPSSTSPVPDPLHTATTTTPATTYINNNNGGPPLTANQQTQKRMQFKEGPKFGLKSMVSMDDMPDLFASFDKLIPKPASTCEESPLYLCLRMGTPIGKVIPRSTPIMTYGRKTMRPEYWFSIPKNRTDELYNFFQIWASEVYGELDELVIRDRGFNVLEEEVEICPQPPGNGGVGDGFDAAGELKEMTKESWEVVSMSEELRKALYSSSSLTSLDIEAFLPEIQAKSEIIDESIRKNMYRNLPARVQGYNWNLVFSSSQHGFSLKSLYRKMFGIDSAVLLFIQDTNQNIFGAFLACPLRVSDLFYGTGEAFLFKCQPEFEVYPWTGENTFFARGNNESLVIGGGDGKFGILLDGDLYQGRSEKCKTFDNPILSGTEDFIIKTIECWYFE